MDFTLSPEIEKLRRKTRDFISAEVVPLARALAKEGIDFWKWGRDVQG